MPPTRNRPACLPACPPSHASTTRTTFLTLSTRGTKAANQPLLPRHKLFELQLGWRHRWSNRTMVFLSIKVHYLHLNFPITHNLFESNFELKARVSHCFLLPAIMRQFLLSTGFFWNILLDECSNAPCRPRSIRPKTMWCLEWKRGLASWPPSSSWPHEWNGASWWRAKRGEGPLTALLFIRLGNFGVRSG